MKKVETKVQKILQSEISNKCKLLKLYGLALSLTPNSPKQNIVRKEIDKLISLKNEN